MSTPASVAKGGKETSRHYRVVGKCPKCQRPFHKRKVWVSHMAKCGKVPA